MSKFLKLANSILNESYKVVKNKFIAQGIDANRVQNVLDKHKLLKNRNKLENEFINIDVLANKHSFKFIEDLVNSKSLETRSQKKNKITSELAKHIVYRDDDYTIYLPQSIDEIIQLTHSPKTDWCISNGDIEGIELALKSYMGLLGTNDPNILYIAVKNKQIPDDEYNYICIQHTINDEYIHTVCPNSVKFYSWPSCVNKLAQEVVVFRSKIYNHFVDILGKAQ